MKITPLRAGRIRGKNNIFAVSLHFREKEKYTYLDSQDNVIKMISYFGWRLRKHFTSYWSIYDLFVNKLHLYNMN